MRLEDVTAELRPRGRWEAVDLGFALTRRHFPRLLAAWALTVFPVWAALLALSPWISVVWSLVLIWWLKPLYDRVPLFVMSRALFGATPRLREVVRAWPQFFLRGLWGALVARRLSASRALLIPLAELEGISGPAGKARADVLRHHSGGTASNLTILCVAYEVILAVALLFLGMMFVPEGVIEEMGDDFFDTVFLRGAVPPVLLWTCAGCYLAAMMLVELFFVGGGFGLYLNCRTHLEGWDVELTFRRLARRLVKVVAAFAAAAVFAGAAAHAKDEAIELSAEEKAVKEEIGAVLAHEDFKVHTIKVPKARVRGSSYGTPFAALGYILFWAAVIAGIAWLVWFIVKNRHALSGMTRADTTRKPAPPRTLMGMDVSPESLPDDIVGAARQLWLDGNAHAALSILYRGAVSWLAHAAALPVRDSDTEGDCLRHTRALPDAQQRDYFHKLTGQWVTVAYGERPPASLEMEALLGTWPFASGGRAT